MDIKSQPMHKVSGKSINPIDVIEYFNAIWLQSDSYFNEKIAPDWNMNDALYRDNFGIIKRISWQSECTAPVVDQLVTRITQFFTRIIVNTYEDFFVVNHKDEMKRKAYTEVLRAILRDNKFAATVFPRALSYAWLNALFITKTEYGRETQCYPLLNSETGKLDYTEEIVGRVNIRPVAPRNFRLDPVGDRYEIEIVPDVSLSEFMDMATTNKWANADKIKRELLSPVEQPIDKKQDTIVKSNHLPTVTLYYVYSQALTDRTGGTILKDCKFILANKEYLLHIDYNDGINGSTPYTVHNPMMDVYGRYGRPYISKVRSLIKQYINCLNLAMDAGVLSALGIHELNQAALSSASAHTVTADLEPGKMMIKTNEQDLIKSTYPPNNTMQAILQMLYVLDQLIQNHSYQSEFFTGAPTAKGRPTLGEVQIKTQQNNTFFTDIATQVENLSLQPTLEKALYTYLIHMDDTSNLRLLENIKDENVRGYIKTLPYADRIADIRQLQIEVKGMSGKIQRQNNFSKVIQLLGVLGNFPGANQALTVGKLIEQGFSVVDSTPDEFYDMDMLNNLMAATVGQMTQPTPGQPGMNGMVAGGMEQPPNATMAKESAEQNPMGV